MVYVENKRRQLRTDWPFSRDKIIIHYPGMEGYDTRGLQMNLIPVIGSLVAPKNKAGMK